MESTKTYQTAFRFTPDLMTRLKNRARLEKLSLNAFVEGVLIRHLETEDSYQALIGKVKNLRVGEMKELPFKESDHIFSKEEIQADERLEYILRRNDEDIH